MKYQAETTGVAPIAALLLAAMMVASLIAMNMTAERVLNPGFTPNPLAALTGPGFSRGISLRGVAGPGVEAAAHNELAAVRRAIQSAIAGTAQSAQPALEAAASVAPAALDLPAPPAVESVSPKSPAKKPAKSSKVKKGSAAYAGQSSQGPKGKAAGKAHGKS